MLSLRRAFWPTIFLTAATAIAACGSSNDANGGGNTGGSAAAGTGGSRANGGGATGTGGSSTGSGGHGGSTGTESGGSDGSPSGGAGASTTGGAAGSADSSSTGGSAGSTSTGGGAGSTNAGGSDAPPTDAAPSDASSPTDATSPSSDAASAAFALASPDFLTKNGMRLFTAAASYPMDHSPGFTWGGVPAGTRSLALTFVDRSSNDATKWVVWNLPPTATSIPANVPAQSPMPAELGGATQRGSLGRTGYSGPGVKGPPLHTYEFILWALDVATLPGTDGVDTATIRTSVLTKHTLAKTDPFVAQGQLGGP